MASSRDIQTILSGNIADFTKKHGGAALESALLEDSGHTYAENITRIVREFRAAQTDGTFTLTMGRLFNLRIIAAGVRAGIDQDAVSADYQDELNATAF